jgi:hypothetical protein
MSIYCSGAYGDALRARNPRFWTPHFGQKTGFRARMNEKKSGIPCSGCARVAIVPQLHEPHRKRTRLSNQLSLDHLDQQVDAFGRLHHPDLSIVLNHVGVEPDKDDRLAADRTHDLAHPRTLARLFVAPMLVLVDLDDHVVRGQNETDVGSALGARGVEAVIVVLERRADHSAQVLHNRQLFLVATLLAAHAHQRRLVAEVAVLAQTLHRRIVRTDGTVGDAVLARGLVTTTLDDHVVIGLALAASPSRNHVHVGRVVGRVCVAVLGTVELALAVDGVRATRARLARHLLD